ncbi:MAG: hypothetical protein J6U54_05455 [Clostridiales bacterium]|nr:hypothetical protein [Clostridiales bacterium]
MAIKASDQITVVDLTDAYSVVLSIDAITLNGGQTTLGSQKQVVVNVLAFRGADQLDPSVTQSQIVCPTNVSASVGSVSNHVLPITFTFAAALNAAGTIQIPVVVDSDITITKVVSFSIAFSGTPGSPGAAGADAITLTITSSNGTIFKNTAIATTLTAHVYKAGAEVTGSSLSALGTIKWYKDGGSTAVGTGATLTISAGQVTDKAYYTAQLESN